MTSAARELACGAGLVPREDFLRAMRCVASSVTVVTTDGPGGRHGATVSAFCSLSADPPSALVCLKAESRIARLVAAQPAFSASTSCRRAAATWRSALPDFMTAWRSDRFAAGGLRRGRPSCTGAGGRDRPLLRPLGEHQAQQPSDISWGGSSALRIAEIAPLAYHNGSYCQVAPRLSHSGDLRCRSSASKCSRAGPANRKRQLVQEMTDGFLRACGGRREGLHVVITEVEQENWGAGGELVADRTASTKS